MFGRRRERIPAAGDPLRIGVAPAGRRRHRPLVKARAGAIADPVEREQLFLREFRRLGQGRLRDAVAKIGVKPVRAERPVAGGQPEREKHVVERRAVGHRGSPNESSFPKV